MGVRNKRSKRATFSHFLTVFYLAVNFGEFFLFLARPARNIYPEKFFFAIFLFRSAKSKKGIRLDTRNDTSFPSIYGSI